MPLPPLFTPTGIHRRNRRSLRAQAAPSKRRRAPEVSGQASRCSHANGDAAEQFVDARVEMPLCRTAPDDITLRVDDGHGARATGAHSRPAAEPAWRLCARRRTDRASGSRFTALFFELYAPAVLPPLMVYSVVIMMTKMPAGVFGEECAPRRVRRAGLSLAAAGEERSAAWAPGRFRSVRDDWRITISMFDDLMVP